MSSNLAAKSLYKKSSTLSLARSTPDMVRAMADTVSQTSGYRQTMVEAPPKMSSRRRYANQNHFVSKTPWATDEEDLTESVVAREPIHNNKSKLRSTSGTDLNHVQQHNLSLDRVERLKASRLMYRLPRSTNKDFVNYNFRLSSEASNLQINDNSSPDFIVHEMKHSPTQVSYKEQNSSKFLKNPKIVVNGSLKSNSLNSNASPSITCYTYSDKVNERNVKQNVMFANKSYADLRASNTLPNESKNHDRLEYKLNSTINGKPDNLQSRALLFEKKCGLKDNPKKHDITDGKNQPAKLKPVMQLAKSQTLQPKSKSYLDSFVGDVNHKQFQIKSLKKSKTSVSQRQPVYTEQIASHPPTNSLTHLSMRSIPTKYSISPLLTQSQFINQTAIMSASIPDATKSLTNLYDRLTFVPLEQQRVNTRNVTKSISSDSLGSQSSNCDSFLEIEHKEKFLSEYASHNEKAKLQTFSNLQPGKLVGFRNRFSDVSEIINTNQTSPVTLTSRRPNNKDLNCQLRYNEKEDYNHDVNNCDYDNIEDLEYQLNVKQKKSLDFQEIFNDFGNTHGRATSLNVISDSDAVNNIDFWLNQNMRCEYKDREEEEQNGFSENFDNVNAINGNTNNFMMHVLPKVTKTSNSVNNNKTLIKQLKIDVKHGKENGRKMIITNDSNEGLHNPATLVRDDIITEDISSYSIEADTSSTKSDFITTLILTASDKPCELINSFTFSDVKNKFEDISTKNSSNQKFKNINLEHSNPLNKLSNNDLPNHNSTKLSSINNDDITLISETTVISHNLRNAISDYKPNGYSVDSVKQQFDGNNDSLQIKKESNQSLSLSSRKSMAAIEVSKAISPHDILREELNFKSVKDMRSLFESIKR